MNFKCYLSINQIDQEGDGEILAYQNQVEITLGDVLALLEENFQERQMWPLKECIYYE